MQEQLDALVQTLANGGIDNMDEYKYMQKMMQKKFQNTHKKKKIQKQI